MKDKEKQIEEMAIKELADGLDITMCGAEEILTYLTKQGYQKIDKDSVVLTREEYEKINFYKELYEETYMRERKLNEFNSNLIIDNQMLKDKLELKGKETAENILKDLIKNCQFVFDITGKPIIALDGDFAINIAKQYGVEIKE